MRELTTLDLDAQLAEQLPSRELMSVIRSFVVVAGDGDGNGNGDGTTVFSFASALNGDADGNGNGDVYVGNF